MSLFGLESLEKIPVFLSYSLLLVLVELNFAKSDCPGAGCATEVVDFLVLFSLIVYKYKFSGKVFSFCKVGRKVKCCWHVITGAWLWCQERAFRSSPSRASVGVIRFARGGGSTELAIDLKLN